MRSSALLIPITALLGLTLVACGGGASPSSSSARPTGSSASPTGPEGTWETANCWNGESTPSDSTDLAPISGVTGIRVGTYTDAKHAPLIAVESGLAPAASLGSVDLKQGSGSPVQPGANVVVAYCGVGQQSRTVFDSSWESGGNANFNLNKVIVGWQKGIVGMREFGRRLLVVPADQAYGDSPPDGSGILPGETLIFVVELYAWNGGTPDPNRPAWMTTDCATGDSSGSATTDIPVDQGTDGVRVSATESSKAPSVAIADMEQPATQLLIKDLIPGSGDQEVVPGDTVTVNYCGIGLETRKLFDASWLRGEPATFGLNRVIKGWTEGLPGMKVGTRRLLIIPAADAYGDTPPDGSGILPGETLVFVVDLISIN